MIAGCLDYTDGVGYSGTARKLCGIMLGLAIVMRVEKPVNVSAITNPVAWIPTILPPVYYLAWVLPRRARYLALAVPTSASAEVARQLAGMGSSVELSYPVAVVLAWTVASLAAASRTIR